MTQLMFKGYEEARVTLTTLLFTIPCCVLIGVEYGVFNSGTLIKDVRDINVLTDYRDQLYAAVCLSVINSIEKILRCGWVCHYVVHCDNQGAGWVCVSTLGRGTGTLHRCSS